MKGKEVYLFLIVVVLLSTIVVGQVGVIEDRDHGSCLVFRQDGTYYAKWNFKLTDVGGIKKWKGQGSSVTTDVSIREIFGSEFDRFDPSKILDNWIPESITCIDGDCKRSDTNDKPNSLDFGYLFGYPCIGELFDQGIGGGLCLDDKGFKGREIDPYPGIDCGDYSLSSCGDNILNLKLDGYFYDSQRIYGKILFYRSLGECSEIGCGNGKIDLREECDDGNLVNGDGCSSDCRWENECGNGIIEIGEQCDGYHCLDGVTQCNKDGNGEECGKCVDLNNNLEECGDFDTECQCIQSRIGDDDISCNSEDICEGSCGMPRGGSCVNCINTAFPNNDGLDDSYPDIGEYYCSDGFLINSIPKPGNYDTSVANNEYPEKCDDFGSGEGKDSDFDIHYSIDGDKIEDDGKCVIDISNYGRDNRVSCKLNVCGDGYLYLNKEGCDDGNLESGDGCSSICLVERKVVDGNEVECRDGKIGFGESCEVGNPLGNKCGWESNNCNKFSCICENIEDNNIEIGEGVCGDGLIQNPNSNGEREMCDQGENNGKKGYTCDLNCVYKVNLHTTCVDQSCMLYDGVGVDECYVDSQCTKLISVCDEDDICRQIEVGENVEMNQQCSTSEDCGKLSRIEKRHAKCSGNMCEIADGSLPEGAIACNLNNGNDDCVVYCKSGRCTRPVYRLPFVGNWQLLIAVLIILIIYIILFKNRIFKKLI